MSIKFQSLLLISLQQRKMNFWLISSWSILCCLSFLEVLEATENGHLHRSTCLILPLLSIKFHSCFPINVWIYSGFMLYQHIHHLCVLFHLRVETFQESKYPWNKLTCNCTGISPLPLSLPLHEAGGVFLFSLHWDYTKTDSYVLRARRTQHPQVTLWHKDIEKILKRH